MKKVLLVNYADKNAKITEPLGICYLASSLRSRGFQTDLLDSRVKGFDLDDFADHISGIMNEYFLIGISTSQDFGLSVEDSPAAVIVRNLRKNGYDGHITLGGYGPSLDWETYMRIGPDSVNIGEGEIILCNLASALLNGEDWTKLKGMVYIDENDRVIRNPNEEIVPFDEIPAPSREILDALAERYGKIHTNPSVQTSRGCYMQCAYCTTPLFMRNQGGPVYRTRSIKSVVDEIEELYKKGYVYFDFIDDNFLPPRKEDALKRATELRDEMKARNIKMHFWMEFRLEYISREILEILKEAGLRSLFIGVESFNEQDLKLYNRRYDVQKLCNAIDQILAAGFSPDLNSEYRFRYGFINVNPLSTIATLRNTGVYFKKYNFTYKKLCKRLYMYDNNTSILQNVLKDYPEYTNDNYFKHEEVGMFYEGYSGYHEEYVKYRNRGRNYEKRLMKEIRAENNAEEYQKIVDELVAMRKELDNDVWNVYMEGLDIAEKEDFREKLPIFFEERSRAFEQKKAQYETTLKKGTDAIGEEYGDIEKFYS